MAESTTVSLPDIETFKRKALVWANHFRVVCLLDSNNYSQDKYSSREWVLAVDPVEELQTHVAQSSFEKLKSFTARASGEVFGFLTYDLKNDTEKLTSKNFDGLLFPELYFFKPRYVFEIKGDKITVNRNYPETYHLLEIIQNLKADLQPGIAPLELRARTSRKEYLQKVESIRQQIEAGDFYELNYCNEFYNDSASINPIQTFLQLNSKASAPFSSFFKLDDKYLLCASPERFLKKQGKMLISQPIKGTIRKGTTAAENAQLKAELKNNPKEQAENVMIVDLVRNDLARSSKPGSVKVEELCGIYEFNTVNQMISTVIAEVCAATEPVEAIRNAFPMGSMTGAPKIEVMKNIEHYEMFKRSLFSGSVGYITPGGNFDFNVVIRSILYNATVKYISVRVGGAITYDSTAEKEWEELLLKAESLLKAVNAKII